MKKILLSFALILSVCLFAQAQSEKTVNFEKGKTSAVVTGVLNGDKYIDFVVNVRQGQIMYLMLTPELKTHLTIYDPDKDNVPDAFEIGGAMLPLDYSGNYTIRVRLWEKYRKQKSGIPFTLKIEVKDDE
jgi:hypothetical protein